MAVAKKKGETYNFSLIPPFRQYDVTCSHSFLYKHNVHNETYCPLIYCLHKFIFTTSMEKEILLKKFGKMVKLRRMELNLTQEELAYKCGFDRTYISLVERGLRNISLSNLSILVSGLETTISILTKDL